MTCTVIRNISVAVEVLNHGASAAYSCNVTQIGVNWEHSKDYKLCSKWFPDLKWSSYKVVGVAGSQLWAGVG